MRAFSIISILFLISFNSSLAQESTETERAAIQSFKLAPSYFIPNQVSQKTGKRLVDDAEVTAFVQTQKGRVMFTPSGAYIGMAVPLDEFEKPGLAISDKNKQMDDELQNIQTRTVVLKAGFSNAQAKKRGMTPRLEEVTGGIVNFMVGPKENWRTKVPTYRKLVYDQVWDGINLEYLGYMDHLEFQLQLEPGSDPNQIVMETGADDLKILEDGQVVVSLAGAELVMSAPYAYQEINGETVEVPVQFQILDGSNLGFLLGNFAKDVPLVIDPTLTWSTFLGGPGGEGEESGRAIAVDNNDNAYITGFTPSADYPATAGTYDESWNGGQSDVFVTKLNSTGSDLAYSTFLGGASEDHGYGIAVDGSGNAFVTGYTFSSDYPSTSGSFEATHQGKSDVFVSKLNSDGTALIYSTFLGGTGLDAGFGIALDGNGNAYLTGYTESSGYPTTIGAFDEMFNGPTDAFVSKLSSDGSDLSYSTLLGGTNSDYGTGIAVDSSGLAYVAGYTQSGDYPTTSGAFGQTYNGGASDVFLSKLSSDGRNLYYSTFLGGTGWDEGQGITVDTSGNAYVTGNTGSSDYPTTSGTFVSTFIGNKDVFVTKVNNDGSSLVYSTFLGGTRDDEGAGIAVDSGGNAYVTGYTYSWDYPTTSGAYDQTYNGYDLFVTKLSSDGTALIYSTFLGGSYYDYGYGIAVDTSGNAYVTGYAGRSDYPTTSGGFDRTYNGGDSDGFVSKLSSDGSNLIYSTFLGGTALDKGHGIAVDNNGNVYVTGSTRSVNFPTTSGAYGQTYNGWDDVFVSKLNPEGGGLIYSTFLGGTSGDYGVGISVDSSGNVFVTGDTWSNDYPTTNEAYDQTYNGGLADVFVSEISSDGSDLIYSTFLGGSGWEAGKGIAVDASGHAYVTGWTKSSGYPTTSGAYDETLDGYEDVFVSKLSSDGSALSYSTFLGGKFDDGGVGIAVDSGGNAYVAGYTDSSDFPTTSGAYAETSNDSYHSDVFVSKLNPDGSDLGYSTFLGGTSFEGVRGIAVDNSGNAYVTGYTDSSDFPTTSGAYAETYKGQMDVFVSKLSSDGSVLIYSTFLGDSDSDVGEGIAADNSGNAYVTGYTESSDFPTTSGAYAETYNGQKDVFVSKLSSDGSVLIYSTFLGDSDSDVGEGIAVDSSGNAYVTGTTYSSDYPTTSGAYIETQNGYGDAFVTKFLFFYDFNHDGCSNALDFSFLLPYWNQLIEPTHTATVLDLLQIYMDGPVPCP